MSHESDDGDTGDVGMQATIGEHSSEGFTPSAVPEGGTESSDPLIGRVLKGAYRVEELIGQGGMGAVYRGVQLAVDRPVAIKVLRPAGFMQESAKQALTARFRREAVATSALNHPNTVRLFDFGEGVDGVLFLVLELLRGLPLSDVIRAEGALEPSRVAAIGYQMCRSLAEAHSNGIVHRDLKPDNVFLCDFEDQADFVKIMDFGIARVVESDATKGVTQTGATVGTPAYMAPEQAMAAEIHPATDLYSLGIMLYEMLNGRVPFSGETFMSVALRHLNETPPPLTLPGVPEHVIDGWQALLDSLLAKVPEQRPKSTREVGEALKALERVSAEARIATRPDALALPEFVRNAARGPKGEAPAATSGLAPSEITMAEQAGIRPTTPQNKGVKWAMAAVALLALGAGAYALSQSGSTAPKPSVAQGPAQGETIATTAPSAAVNPGAVIAAPANNQLQADAASKDVAHKAPAIGATLAGTAAGAELARAVPPAQDPGQDVKARLARLKVVTTPAGADVFRGGDDAAVCKTPCDVELTPGEDIEELRLVAPGHEPKTFKAELTPGTTYATTVALVAVKPVRTKPIAASKKKKKKKAVTKTEPTKAVTKTGTSGTTVTKKKKKVRIPSFSGSDPTRN